MAFLETADRRSRAHAETLSSRKRGVTIHVLKKEPVHVIGSHLAARENLFDGFTYVLQSVPPYGVGVEARVVLPESEISGQKPRRPATARRKLAPEVFEPTCIGVDHRSDEAVAFGIENGDDGPVSEERCRSGASR